MNSPRVPRALRTRWLGCHVEDHELVDSTNARAWERVSADAPHGTVVVAGRQTAGRGRQGREWTSALGNLFASILLRPTGPHARDAAVSLVIGLEIARTLRDAFAVADVGVKWPNDVHVAGRKIAGILVEGRFDPPARMVAGFGVNLCRPDDGWGDLEGRASALDEVGPSVGPGAFLEELLPRLESALDDFWSAGFTPRQEDWRAVDVLAGRTILYERDGHRAEGRVEGVDTSGALCVVGPDGSPVRLHGGEVHLVGVEP